MIGHAPMDTHYVAVHYRRGAWLVCTNDSHAIVSPPLTRRQAEDLAADMNAEQLELFDEDER